MTTFRVWTASRLALGSAFFSLAINLGLIAWLGFISPAVLPERVEPPRAIELSFARQRQPAAPSRTRIEILKRRDLAGHQLRSNGPKTVDTNPAPQQVGGDGGRSNGSGASPGVSAGGALSTALRARLGCQHADFLHLSPGERERCAERAAQGSRGTEIDVLAGIAPEKRAVFDAQVKADSEPQHMAGVFCAIRFGVKGTSTLKVLEAKQVGKLPCFIAGPKATVIEDHAP